MIRGLFAEGDVRDGASYGSSPLCIWRIYPIHVYVCVHTCTCIHALHRVANTQYGMAYVCRLFSANEPYSKWQNCEKIRRYVKDKPPCGSSPPFTVVRYTLQDTAKHGNTRQHTATCCKTLRYAATYCNTLQHTVPHCNKHTTSGRLRKVARLCAPSLAICTYHIEIYYIDIADYVCMGEVVTRINCGND